MVSELRIARSATYLCSGVLLLLLACSGKDSAPCVDGDKVCGQSCDFETPCPAGLYCGGGACAKQCVVGSSTCGSGRVCTRAGMCSDDAFGNSTTAAMDPGKPTAGSDAGSDDLPLTTDDACGLGLNWAKLTPVNMLVMFDRSGSMKDNNKWEKATAALTAFFQEPSAAELRIALRFFPHDEPASGCNDEDCDADACSKPLVGIGPLTVEAAPADGQEADLVGAINATSPGGGNSDGGGQGTPIYAALDGALRWAAAEQQSHPNEKTVVVFVTDGKPNGCDEDFDHIAKLASDALASSGVTTYAIGLEGSSEAQMDQIAAAGGTGKGIFIGQSTSAEQELLAALTAIRGQNLSCDFAVPGPVGSGKVDPSKISVTFVYGNGTAPTRLGQVSAMPDCGGAESWYYDDPSSPQRIFLCPTSCDKARAEEDTGLQILLGCDTPKTMECAKNPDAPECVVM